MRMKLLGLFTSVAALTQTGCVDLSLRDAVAAGVFDFVAGSITAALTSLFALPA